MRCPLPPVVAAASGRPEARALALCACFWARLACPSGRSQTFSRAVDGLVFCFTNLDVSDRGGLSIVPQRLLAVGTRPDSARSTSYSKGRVVTE